MGYKTFSLLFAFGSAFFIPSAAAQNVTPHEGGQGTEVVVSGFETLVGEPAVVLLGPSGEGVPVDGVVSTDLGLVGNLGPSGVSFQGEIEVWWGRRVELPRHSVDGTGFLYTTRSASWFQASGRSLGSAPFAFSAPSSNTQSGSLDPSQSFSVANLVVLLEDPPGRSVRVDIMLPGGKGAGGGGSFPPTVDELLNIDISVRQTPFTHNGPNAKSVARDLASTLALHLGPLGFSVTSTADAVVISKPDDATRSVFVSLTTE